MHLLIALYSQNLNRTEYIGYSTEKKKKKSFCFYQGSIHGGGGGVYGITKPPQTNPLSNITLTRKLTIKVEIRFLHKKQKYFSLLQIVLRNAFRNVYVYTPSKQTIFWWNPLFQYIFLVPPNLSRKEPCIRPWVFLIKQFVVTRKFALF